MKFISSFRKSTIGLLLLFFIPCLLLAQVTYVIKPTTDFALIGAGAITLTLGQVFENNHQGLTVSEIDNLSQFDINRFDRNAVYNYSETAEKWSDVMLYSTVAIPLSLLASKDIRNQWITIGVMGLEVLMISSGVTTTIKATVLRARPYTYNPDVSLELKQEKDARYSFFSRHTAASASMTFFAAKVYSDTYPNSKWKPAVWVGAALIPAVTAFARVESGNHFPTDVIAGYAFGAAIGYFIPVLHLKKENEKAILNLEPNVNGLALRLIF